MPMPAARLEELRLPPLLATSGTNEDVKGTAYHLTLDANSAKHPVSTGISAHDRSLCARLVASGAGPEEFTRPGHVVPLRYTTGGTRTRFGHTEAAVGEYQLSGSQRRDLAGSRVTRTDTPRPVLPRRRAPRRSPL